jgi:hypothetical protein
MALYYDPTEAREGTKMPEVLLNEGKALPGLETLTGADVLMTAKECPLAKLSPRMPRPLLNAFLDVTSHGILMQRKSGADLVHSLTDLDSILLRMREWVGQRGEAWLVSTGVHDEDMAGNIVIDGRSTSVRYTRVMARVSLWQRRGGYYVNLTNDRRLVSWCQRWEQSWFGKPEIKVVRTPNVVLVDAPYWDHLTVIPGVGHKIALAIHEWLPEGHKTLGDALAYLSWVENYNPKDKPDGVGPSLFVKTSKWLGMREGEAFRTYVVPPKGTRGGE